MKLNRRVMFQATFALWPFAWGSSGRAAGRLINKVEPRGSKISANLDAGSYTVPAREIPIPAHLSPVARMYLVPRAKPAVYPALDDKAGWQAFVDATNKSILPLLRRISAGAIAEVTERKAGLARVFEVIPSGLASTDRTVVLEMHGGALVFCSGELCKLMAQGSATRLQRRVWSVDYRMPPAHPFPAALDDGLAAYRALLKEREPGEIIVSGGSAGGNLAAALLLRARDEGLPMPAGLILSTPEIDLTETGDTFNTLLGVDPSLGSLMPVNLLYANGTDLKHPYLSPLFGDLTGFPPVILTSGTRDLYLSNTVRMHRALRAVGVQADLHLTEAGPHTGFPGGPEGSEIDKEVQNFITRCTKKV